MKKLALLALILIFCSCGGQSDSSLKKVSALPPPKAGDPVIVCLPNESGPCRKGKALNSPGPERRITVEIDFSGEARTGTVDSDQVYSLAAIPDDRPLVEPGDAVLIEFEWRPTGGTNWWRGAVLRDKNGALDVPLLHDANQMRMSAKDMARFGAIRRWIIASGNLAKKIRCEFSHEFGYYQAHPEASP